MRLGYHFFPNRKQAQEIRFPVFSVETHNDEESFSSQNFSFSSQNQMNVYASGGTHQPNGSFGSMQGVEKKPKRGIFYRE